MPSALASDLDDSDRRPFALLLIDLRFATDVGEIAILGRMDGDEFVVLVPEAAAAQAKAVADQLLAMLEQPFELEASQIEIGCSIGIALYPEHGADADTLLRQADVAMYAARRSDTGYVVYGPEADRQRPERLEMAAERRHAIERGEPHL